MSMNMKRSRRRATGATLVEAMIALGILAIGLAGFSTSMVAAARQDRRNSARAAAQTMADELARIIATWDYNDPRLSLGTYTGTNFSKPTISDTFTVTPATTTAPATISETLTPNPNHTEAELIPATGTSPKYGGRMASDFNLVGPGRTYVFRRYWNVMEPSTVPPSPIKLVAVHVTYSISSTKRGLVTAYTSVMDRAALIDRISE